MTSAEDRKRKRECAGTIAGLGLPTRKVARLLDTMKSMPEVLDMGLTRWDFRTSIDDGYAKVKESRRLPTVDGGEAVWEFASFAKLFVHTVAERPASTRVLQRTHGAWSEGKYTRRNMHAVRSIRRFRKPIHEYMLVVDAPSTVSLGGIGGEPLSTMLQLQRTTAQKHRNAKDAPRRHLESA